MHPKKEVIEEISENGLSFAKARKKVKQRRILTKLTAHSQRLGRYCESSKEKEQD